LKAFDEVHKEQSSDERINSSLTGRICLKLGEINKIIEMSSRVAVMDFVRKFISKLQRKFQEELQKIYHNQGRTNSREEDFDENAIFLREVSLVIPLINNLSQYKKS
jgi:hypothetical protein